MSTTFSMTRDGIINAALRLMMVLAEGETAKTGDITNGAEALNLMLKEWAENGKKPWCIKTLTTAFVANKSNWTIGPSGDITPDRPQTVLNGWYFNAQNQRFPMFMRERADFFRLSPSNQTSSAPTNWYYDAQLTNGVYWIWPLNIDTSGTLAIDGQFAIADVLNPTDVVQVAPSTYNAVKWGLAQELVTEYGVNPDIRKVIMLTAPSKIAAAADLEEEQGSVRFQPTFRGNR